MNILSAVVSLFVFGLKPVELEGLLLPASSLVKVTDVPSDLFKVIVVPIAIFA